MNALPTAPTAAWKPTLTALVAMVLVLFGLYHETAFAMERIWARSDTFAHAFLVAPISLWLIWEKRHVLALQAPQPTLWLALPLAGLAFGWLLGEMAAVNAVTQLAFTCMLILAVPLVIGLPAARLIAFPLGFLLFAVPIGEFVMPTLMDWTATFTIMALRASGIPVYAEGRHFVIPSGSWSVVEACSGVRYLLASLTVGTLFAYLNYRSTKRRLLFVGVSILVPIVANWLRAYMIVMLGHLSGGKIATGVDHLIYGWVFFGIVIMIMFAIGMKWREDLTVAGDRQLPKRAGGPAAGAARQSVACLLFAVIVAAPHAALWALESSAPLPPPKLDARALARAGWNVAPEPLADWKPAFTNPSAEIIASLADGDRHVGVYIAYYRQQDYERKLVSSENVLVRSTDKDWIEVGRSTRSITLDGQVVTVRSGRLHTTGGAEKKHLLAWHWYWINGRVTASDYLGKAFLALSKLTGQGDDSAAVVLYAPEDQPGGAEAAMDAYLASGGSGMAAVLADAKKQR